MRKCKQIKILKSPDEIPEFPNERAEAEFWQTHSPVEIFEELPPADDVEFVPVAKRLIPLPLDEKLYKKIQRKAHQQGISPLTLIQRWVELKLRIEKRDAERRGKRSHAERGNEENRKPSSKKK